MSLFGGLIAQYFDYETLKIVHMFGIVLFVGNIVVTAWWKSMADRTRDFRIIAFAQRQVTMTDWVFTLGGVLIIGGTAFGMVAHLNPDIVAEIHAQRWLAWGYYQFLASGVIWGLILIPTQIAQARLALGFTKTGDIPARYWHYGRVWMGFGILATLIPLANIYWMVAKS